MAPPWVCGYLLPPSTLEYILGGSRSLVAMDTSLPFGLKFAGPLPTLKGPVPKLVYWR